MSTRPAVRAHRQAVISFFEEALPGDVFQSYSAAAGRARYAVVFMALSRREQARFTGGQTRDTYTVTVHSVGVDEDSCLWVAERVGGLTDQVLTVPGRTLWPAEYITSKPPDLDDDGPDPLWFTITQFDITSDPA